MRARLRPSSEFSPALPLQHDGIHSLFSHFFDSQGRKWRMEDGTQHEIHPMTLDPQRVQAVFLAAIEQENLPDRDEILDRECAADEELRRRVQALLIAHDHPDSLLDRPFVDPGEPVMVMFAQPAERADEIDATDPDDNLTIDRITMPRDKPAPGETGDHPGPRSPAEIPLDSTRQEPPG